MADLIGRTSNSFETIDGGKDCFEFTVHDIGEPNISSAILITLVFLR